MPLFRYTLTPKGALGTLIRSDTLHGHLVCAAAELHGESEASQLIERFEADAPPFVCSSALPEDMLPMPCLPPIPRRDFKKSVGEKTLFKDLTKYKKFKKSKYIPLSLWKDLRGRMSLARLFEAWCGKKDLFSCDIDGEPWSKSHINAHNTIDRATGSVLQEGGFYLTEDVYFHKKAVLNLYVRTDDRPRFEKLLAHIAETGYGRDSNLGKGHFEFKLDEAFDARELDGADGAQVMSLSTLSAMDLSEMKGWYMTFSKHGKVWDGFGETNPFKKPILAIAEGGVFSRLPKSGYVLRGVHTDPKIVQIMQPLTIPLTIDKGGVL